MVAAEDAAGKPAGWSGAAIRCDRRTPAYPRRVVTLLRGRGAGDGRMAGEHATSEQQGMPPLGVLCLLNRLKPLAG